MDKNEIFQKFSYTYSSNSSDNIASRHDIILKKREKQKILGKKKENIQTELFIENKIEISEIDEFVSDKCTYCSKMIEDDIILCDNCKISKYCSDACRKKDFRFHSKKCV